MFPASDADRYQNWISESWESCGASPSTLMILAATNLFEEAGEVAGKVKRAIRGDDGYAKLEYKFHQYLDSEPIVDVDMAAVRLHKHPALLEELGDVLCCLAQVARSAGFKMSEVMERNREKMERRIREGTVRGEGDDR